MPREGVYEDLITQALARSLAEAEHAGQPFEQRRMELDWLDDALALHVAERVRRVLESMGRGEEGVSRRTAIVQRLLSLLGEVDARLLDLPGELPVATRDALTWVGPAGPVMGKPRAPVRPEHGLVHPALLFNGSGDISLVHELRREIASADRIDTVLAFLKKSGLNLLREPLARFFERGGELRLLTTTYMGATELRAVQELVEMGGRVRVAYEEGQTRLHAKAWLFHRQSGLCTAYVGSSNLSRAAMTDGVEWNVRVTRRRTPAVVERFEQAFSQLWEANGPDHTTDAHRQRLVNALSRERNSEREDSLAVLMASLEVAPKPHQEVVLEALAAEREHAHMSNLVVAATGTGKTWISAFDYARLRAEGTVQSLLFVAHRKEILVQSRDVFRLVLKDPGFGELWVDGDQPERGRHVFASVQSLRAEVVQRWDPEAVDMLVIDEFHHAAAPSYQALLTHLHPVVRLGLTATPERMDGKDVTVWFDGRVASDIRLWDALDAGLLCPFHYYGVHDPLSAESAWRRGRLEKRELENLYTGDDARAARILDAVGRYVPDPSTMKALGFCVGVAHAELMAERFSAAGIAAAAVHGKTPRDERRAVVRRLRTGQLQVLFTVDLFNEGVDVPEVDTVLFLRPTESATVFLQQLGRGLRKHRAKAQLLVLDFVGHVHADYRYDVRYRALVGGTLDELRGQVEADFPRLPPGCAITLEEQAKETVLHAVKRFVGKSGYSLLVEDLRSLPASTSLASFLQRSDRAPTEVFVPSRRRSWSLLRRYAGHEQRPEREGEDLLRSRVGRLLHVDDPWRLQLWREWLQRGRAPTLASLPAVKAGVLRMLMTSLGEPRLAVEEFQDEIDRLWAFDVVRDELVELLALLEDRVRKAVQPLDTRATTPFQLHATYTRREVVAGLQVTAKGKLREHREGPLWVPEHDLDLFFVTLNKSEDLFKPSIRYADYPLSPTRFHWESQNSTHDETKVGRRYVEHEARGSEVVFFVRERTKDERGESVPFTCVGPATYVRHEGARPMQIEWLLAHPLPPRLFQAGRMVAG